MAGDSRDFAAVEAKAGVRERRSVDGVIVLVNDQPAIGHFGVPGDFRGDAERKRGFDAAKVVETHIAAVVGRAQPHFSHAAGLLRP